MRTVAILAAVLLFAVLAIGLSFADNETAGSDKKEMQDAQQMSATDKETAEMTEYATFGGGCFWGVEAAFQKIDGVSKTEVGYSGGNTDHPTYRQVCTGRTGHAEVVRVTYDPSVCTYQQLLDVFWSVHDPTQVNRQGPDIGEQYRSVIFYHSPEQKKIAEESIRLLTDIGRYPRKIATKVESAPDFWIAEDYHQQYLEKRGLGSCGTH